MAIFTNTITNTKNDIDLPVYEGYGLENCEYMNIFTEAFEDDLDVIEAMHSYDMAEILGNRKIKSVIESKSESDEDYNPEEDEEIGELKEELQTTLEAEGEKAKGKFVEAVKKVWAKIKAFFQGVVRFFKNLGLSSKEFAARNKKYMAQLDTNLKFTQRMYKWNHNTLLTDIPKSVTDVSKFITDLQKTLVSKLANNDLTKEQVEKVKDVMNNYSKSHSDIFRGSVVGKDKVSSEDFSAEFAAYCRGKEKVDISVTKDTVVNFMSILEQTDKKITDINNMEKVIDNQYKTIIRETNALKFEYEVSGAKLGLIKKYNSIVNEHSQLTLSVIRKWSSAIQSCANDYKAVISKAITKSGVMK